MQVNLLWFGEFFGDRSVIIIEHNDKKYRIIYDNKTDSYLPQYIDDAGDIIDFDFDKTDFTYDECIEIITNDN